MTQRPGSYLVDSRRLRSGASLVLLHAVVIGGAVVMLLPFVWMVSTSFKTEAEAFTFPPRFIPAAPTPTSYIELFSRLDFARYFMNTIIVALSVTGTSLFLNSLAAYAFAKIDFRGRDKLFVAILATMMVPGHVTVIPTFLLIRQLGLVNTYAGLIIPGMVSAFGIFLLRQFMRTIPTELVEAAQIDGASEFWIYSRVIVPLCKPALATLGLLTFMGSWNSFFWPLIIATDTDMYTLPVAIAMLRGQYGTQFPLQMAGATVVVLPVIVLFLFLQRYYTRGITLSGMKG
ncbi:MAG: carbohydrate ABC transporter permease [Candidatus Bipolaricaulota bacterium]